MKAREPCEKHTPLAIAKHSHNTLSCPQPPPPPILVGHAVAVGVHAVAIGVHAVAVGSAALGRHVHARLVHGGRHIHAGVACRGAGPGWERRVGCCEAGAAPCQGNGLPAAHPGSTPSALPWAVALPLPRSVMTPPSWVPSSGRGGGEGQRSLPAPGLLRVALCALAPPCPAACGAAQRTSTHR